MKKKHRQLTKKQKRSSRKYKANKATREGHFAYMRAKSWGGLKF